MALAPGSSCGTCGGRLPCAFHVASARRARLCGVCGITYPFLPHPADHGAHSRGLAAHYGVLRNDRATLPASVYSLRKAVDGLLRARAVQRIEGFLLRWNDSSAKALPAKASVGFTRMPLSCVPTVGKRSRRP